MTATEQLNTFVNSIRHDGGVCVEKQNEYLKYADVLYKGYLLYIKVDECGRYVDVWFKKIVGINDVVMFKFKKTFYSFDEFKVYIEFKLPNTIAVKGAIRDVCRALDIPLEIADKISKEYNNSIDELRKKYPEYSEMFDYVEIVNGTIVSIGTHPSGVLVSDLNLSEEVGLCSTSNSPYPVSVLPLYNTEKNSSFVDVF